MDLEFGTFPLAPKVLYREAQNTCALNGDSHENDKFQGYFFQEKNWSQI